MSRARVYIDWRDWWIGYYRGPADHYVCPLPCLVVRWPRRTGRVYRLLGAAFAIVAIAYTVAIVLR